MHDSFDNTISNKPVSNVQDIVLTSQLVTGQYQTCMTNNCYYNTMEHLLISLSHAISEAGYHLIATVVTT